ncbi:hypothetical protein CBM2605_A260139 [Cupriavidus neocaledonicus]|uniref:Uncharacterized protein n=1 Tax=Cupriavidus neocaledonicus TaxID=1040979 RepID=A0ABY1V3Y3_9BURK|nr:hypothetical protein CBM2605_A260139 [Cupriavidus neocaledonicus]
MKNAGIRKDAGVFFCAIQGEAIASKGWRFALRPSCRQTVRVSIGTGPVRICPFKPLGSWRPGMARWQTHPDGLSPSGQLAL